MLKNTRLQLWIIVVQDSIQLDSALSRTAFSFTHCCPGQHSAWLSAVKDSIQLDSALSRTAFSLTHCCPGQHSAWLSAVQDSTQLDSALSTTAFSLTQRCPGQHSDEFANVVNSFVHLSEKSRRLELNYTNCLCQKILWHCALKITVLLGFFCSILENKLLKNLFFLKFYVMESCSHFFNQTGQL